MFHPVCILELIRFPNFITSLLNNVSKLDFSVTSWPPLPEVEVVIPNTVTKENEMDESDDDSDYEDDDFEDPNWHLPLHVNSFTREDVKDDTLFEEESKRDYITPDSEKKSVVF